MKLVLVQPPALMAVDNYSTITQPPLGIAYLAAYARRAGHEVRVVDAVGAAVARLRPWPKREKRIIQGLDFDEIAERIPPETEVIALSIMFTHSWPMVRELSEHLARRFPKARLLAGGEHVTSMPAKVLGESPVQVCILGEGEETLVELLDAFAGGRGLEGVAGIAYRAPDGGVRENPRRERLRDVDSLPWPAWDLLDPMAYQAGGVYMGPAAGRSMPMLASRGCPYRCRFCASPNMWTQLWRVRDPLNVVDEMERYMKVYGATDFQFQDLTAIVRREWIAGFCREIIRRKLDITWSLPVGTRSEAIDRELSGLLYDSGCKHITYAPESGSPRILQAIEKRVSLEHLESSVRDSLDAGLKVCLFMIVGFPMEESSDIRATLRWLRRMARLGVHEAAVSTFVPLPGTALFREVDRVSPIAVDDEYCHWMTGATSLLTVRSWNPRLSDRKLLFLKLWAMASFYLVSYLYHPSRLWRTLANLFSGRQETKVDRVLREFAVKLPAFIRR